MGPCPHGTYILDRYHIKININEFYQLAQSYRDVKCHEGAVSATIRVYLYSTFSPSALSGHGMLFLMDDANSSPSLTDDSPDDCFLSIHDPGGCPPKKRRRDLCPRGLDH